MRMLAGGIGLLSILIAVMIAAVIWSRHTSAISNARKTVLPEVQQLSGHGADGTRATDGITYTPVMAGADLRGLTVATITPGCPMQTYYGLRAGDLITQIDGGPLDMFGSDPGTAEAMLVDAYEKQHPLTVNRGGVQMTLPAKSAAMPTPAPTPGTAGAAPANTAAPTPPANPPVGNHVQNQLDQLRHQLQQQGQ